MAAMQDRTEDKPDEKPRDAAEDKPQEQGQDSPAPEGEGEGAQVDPASELAKSLEGIRAMLAAQRTELQAMRDFVSNLRTGGGLNASIYAEDGGGEGVPGTQDEGDEEYPEIDLESLAKTIGA